MSWMVFRLILTVIGAFAVAWGTVRLGQRLLRPQLEARRRKQLGALNASETCSLCYERVNPLEDFYDRKLERWSHAECVRILLNPMEEENRT